MEAFAPSEMEVGCRVSPAFSSPAETLPSPRHSTSAAGTSVPLPERGSAAGLGFRPVGGSGLRGVALACRAFPGPLSGDWGLGVPFSLLRSSLGVVRLEVVATEEVHSRLPELSPAEPFGGQQSCLVSKRKIPLPALSRNAFCTPSRGAGRAVVWKEEDWARISVPGFLLPSEANQRHLLHRAALRSERVK